MKWLALAAFVAACSSGHGTAVTSGAGSGSAVAAAPAVITDAAGIAAHMGTHVALRGRAGNAKLGAVVMIDGSPIYCLGVESWPPALNGHDVTAHGTLEMSNQFAAKTDESGAVSQGTDGAVTVLRDCAYD